MVDWKVLDTGQSGGRAGLGSKVNCASRVFQEVSGWSQNLHCWSWMERKAIWVELECGRPVLVEMALVWSLKEQNKEERGGGNVQIDSVQSGCDGIMDWKKFIQLKNIGQGYPLLTLTSLAPTRQPCLWRESWEALSSLSSGTTTLADRWRTTEQRGRKREMNIGTKKLTCYKCELFVWQEMQKQKRQQLWQVNFILIWHFNNTFLLDRIVSVDMLYTDNGIRPSRLRRMSHRRL